MVEKRISHEIHVLSNLICRFIDNSSVRIEVDDITGNNFQIIAFIAQRDGTDVFQRDLEQHFGITRSTASKVVSLMARKGLVERQSIPGDARLKKLVLTDRSREILGCIDDEFRELEDVLTEGFSSRETEQIYDYLYRMQGNIRQVEHTKIQESDEYKQEADH